MKNKLSPYCEFDRQQWSHYRNDEPLTLTEDDLDNLRGVNEMVSLKEVEDFYLPLSRLLNLYVTQKQSLHHVTSDFLDSEAPRVPYIIGVAGSVAVGKSTTSRILQALLSRWPNHPNVALVTTDGFLFPNSELEKQGLMSRKGFPESYDVKSLIRFLSDLKAGEKNTEVPLYSHSIYDIIPDEMMQVSQPDIVIIEGLNILQASGANIFVSDFLDFSIYVDADTNSIKQWYLDRVLYFCQGPFREPDNYFHHLSKLNLEEQMKFAEKVWHEINEQNLIENIMPFRERAGLILHKAENHDIDKVMLRKL